MKRVLLFGVLPVLAAGLMAGSLSAAELKTYFVPIPAPVPCSPPTVRTVSVQNTTGAPIYVKKAAIWHGVDVGSLAVVPSEMYRRSDSTLMLTYPEVRFAQPNGTTQLVSDFRPDYFVVNNNDFIDVNYTCTAFSSPTTFQINLSFTVWYSTTP